MKPNFDQYKKRILNSMMKIILILTLSLSLLACEVEGALTRDKVDQVITPNSILKYSGTFTGTSGIDVSGQAKIYLEGTQYRVKLENFSIESGPDLKVYLSKSSTPTEFVNLGNLTSARVYDIQQRVNIADYSHVLIHCQQYNHLYAIAPLTPN